MLFPHRALRPVRSGSAAQRRVLFDILAVLGKRRRADDRRISPRPSAGFKTSRRVHRPLGAACTDDGVQLVDKEDVDVPVALDLTEQPRVHALVGFAAARRPRHHARKVRAT